jgi:pyruvate/oxaloacetate carboxyltransferase
MGPVGFGQTTPPPTSQIDVQSILNTLGKNNGMDKGAFNLAAQGAYNKVPGQIQKQLTKQQLEAIIMQMQQSPTRAKLFGGK